MTKKFRNDVYWRFRNLKKIGVAIILDQHQVLLAELGDYEPKTLTCKQIAARGIFAINLCSREEKELVSYGISTISFQTLCDICYGRPMSDSVFERFFIKLSGVRYDYLISEKSTDLAKKAALKRLSYNMYNFKTCVNEYGVRYHFLLEADLVPVLHQMYGSIFPVDIEGYTKEIQTMISERDEVKDKLSSEYGISESGLRNQEIDDGEVGKLIHTYQKLSNALKQFSLEKIQESGRNGICCTIRSIGTETFRSTTKQMNLYGLPKRLRKYLVPRNGEILLTMDIHASQIIILAWLAQETKLIDAYEAGEDIYRMMGVNFFSKDVDAVTDLERSAFKRVILLLINGGGINALSDSLQEFGISKSWDEVIRMKAQLFEFLPNIDAYIKKLQTSEMLCLPSGRKWHFDELPDPHKRLARVLQGIESEVLKQSLVTIHEKLKAIPDSSLYMSLHDSITVETTEESKEIVTKCIEESVFDAFQIHFPETKKIIIKEEKRNEEN